MLSYIRPEDHLWDVPVVVFIVWTLVLLISSLIVLSCLRRETKKFSKRLSKADGKEALVNDIPKLEAIMARYVEQNLKLGVLKKLANSLSNRQGLLEAETLRSEAKQWFQQTMTELGGLNMPDKTVKRTILAAVRAGLTQHPLDLRGSRRALEAAKIFLEVDQKKKKEVTFLDTKLALQSEDEQSTQIPSFVCPTMPCQWLAAQVLNLLSLLVSHHNTVPFLFVFGSFVVWFFDCITDMVVIKLLWSFELPLMYPKNDSSMSETTELTYQTLTVDLYAPLLLLILLFSLMFTLLSCSCSRLSDRYRLASTYARPHSELAIGPDSLQDPTTLLARYDFQLSQALTASLPQFCLQFSAYMLILYMLETLKAFTEEQVTLDLIQEKIDNFSFSSLWFSGVASGLSLCVAQYTAFKIQHEHDITLAQRIVYFLSCVFNTIAMMTSSIVLVMVILVPVATYVGRYHLMIIVILGAAILGLGTLISLGLALFSMDTATITTDRVITRFQTNNLLTGFLRFSQVGKGQWETLLGATTLIGKVFSLLTINLFIPPSQLLVHPFQKFYSTSPRSPALHYAIARQLVYYNIVLIMGSILLCMDINEFGFNYGLTPATKNLLVWANLTGVPCLFISLLILFKFYSTHDLWTSNGVHMVFQQDMSTILMPAGVEEGNTTNDSEFEQTNLTVIQEEENEENPTNEADDFPDDISDEIDGPQAESTVIGGKDVTSALNEEDHNESTEADRNHLTEKKKKKKTNKKVVIIKKQTLRLNKQIKKAGGCCSFVVDVAQVEVSGGKWVNVSD